MSNFDQLKLESLIFKLYFIFPDSFLDLVSQSCNSSNLIFGLALENQSLKRNCL